MTLTRLAKDELVNYIKDKNLDIDPTMSKKALVEELMLLGVTSDQN